MEQNANQVASLLKMIANPNKLQILCLLEEGEKTVTELHENISDISMPALSQHLSTLRMAHLIASHRKGQYVIYAIQDQRIIELIHTIKHLYCA